MEVKNVHQNIDIKVKVTRKLVPAILVVQTFILLYICSKFCDESAFFKKKPRDKKETLLM